MNMDSNLADLVAAVGDALPDRCALRHVLITGHDPAQPSPRFPDGVTVPARIEFVPSVVRSPSAKAGYRWARAVLAGTDDTGGAGT